MYFQGLLILAVSLIIPGCSMEPHVIEHVLESSPVRDQSVYVTNHGWHTGFVMPTESANASLLFLKQRFGSVAYYEFGWGDEGFYQAEEITSGLVMRAIFWPTDAVMHVVAIPVEPDKYFINSEVIELKLSNNELNSLQAFINNSFDYTAAGNAKVLAKGIYGNSQFYKAKGKYFMTNTCNTWTAKGLLSTGLDINAGFKLTADSIMSYLKQYKPQSID